MKLFRKFPFYLEAIRVIGAILLVNLHANRALGQVVTVWAGDFNHPGVSGREFGEMERGGAAEEGTGDVSADGMD